MKLRSLIECEIDVEFVDQGKAEAFFIDGTWRETFFDFADLEEAGEHLALQFHKAAEFIDSGAVNRSVEGFGQYVYNKKEGHWRLTEKYVEDGGALPCGDIIIRYETELGCSQVEVIS